MRPQPMISDLEAPRARRWRKIEPKIRVNRPGDENKRSKASNRTLPIWLFETHETNVTPHARDRSGAYGAKINEPRSDESA
ncbi:MAG: hypothetical protein USCAAHI_00564 [Beijerinckiaceae bacterium]|nr:MAG: hypothetical protein USCAAHI_00564 [Beijerinckiaceae bacterium]